MGRSNGVIQPRRRRQLGFERGHRLGPRCAGRRLRRPRQGMHLPNDGLGVDGVTSFRQSLTPLGDLVGMLDEIVQPNTQSLEAFTDWPRLTSCNRCPKPVLGRDRFVDELLPVPDTVRRSMR